MKTISGIVEHQSSSHPTRLSLLLSTCPFDTFVDLQYTHCRDDRLGCWLLHRSRRSGYPGRDLYNHTAGRVRIGRRSRRSNSSHRVVVRRTGSNHTVKTCRPLTDAANAHPLIRPLSHPLLLYQPSHRTRPSFSQPSTHITQRQPLVFSTRPTYEWTAGGCS